MVHSQDYNAYIGIKSGASFPMGDYAGTSLDGGSFATTGYFVSAEGVWFFKPRIGIGLTGGINQHPVDVRALGYERVQADPFLVDTYIRSEAYLLLNGMLGMYYRQMIFHGWTLTGNLKGGIVYGKTPWQLHKQEFFLVGQVYGQITSSQDMNIAGSAGIDIRYEISPCLGLVLNTDVTYSKLSFTFNTAGGTRIDERQIMYINSGLGVQINF